MHQRIAREANTVFEQTRALSDAFDELGKPEQVRGVFLGFQRHLYTSLRDSGTKL
jgi:hypothetical protein